MKRWMWIVAAPVFILLVLVGSAWVILPRLYSDNAATSWSYHSSKHDYSIILPSSDWQEVKKEDMDVAFHNRKLSALAGVSVSKGDEEAFRKSVQRMKDYMDTSKEEHLSTPQFSEGKTDSGDPFAYWTVRAKAEKGGSVFVAKSLVWCRDKNLIVSVLMEGSLRMRSEMGKSTEIEYFEKAGKTICLSVR